MELKSMLSTIITAAISVVVVTSIAIPVISGATIPSTLENADAIKSMLALIPLMLVIAIVLGVVAVAVSRGKN